ncbi:hypothetical protein V2J09_021413 [Rumex salicifolius]
MNVSSHTIERLKAECGFEITTDLDSYLGMPSIIDKINTKLVGWNCRPLSLVGRVTLVKSVLTTIPTYLMSTVCLPLSTCKKIDGILRAFIWGKWDHHRKLHLVVWKEAKILIAKYIRPIGSTVQNTTYVWKGVQKGVQMVILKGGKWLLGNGSLIRFRVDPWLSSEPHKNELIGDLDSDKMNELILVDGIGPFSAIGYPLRLFLSLLLLLFDKGMRLETNDEFSIASAYSIAANSEPISWNETSFFNAIWKLKVP